MKAIMTLLLLTITIVSAGEKEVDYTDALKKRISKVDKVIVRNGGNTCCISTKETLNQEIYKKITDKATIKKLIDVLEFTKGREKNDCLCCGHPGIDFYAGEQRVLLTSWKHGYGLFIDKYVYYFTKESKVKVVKWLLENKIPDKNKEFQKALNEEK